MIRQTLLISALVVASLPFASEPAAAQYVSCESERGKTTRCRMDARNGVRLVRERSQTPCNGNWSYRDGYITVRNGCRGDFEAIRRGNDYNDYGGGSSGGRRVTCESVHNKKTSCPINTRGGVRLVQELSSASCRGNWTADGGYVTVRNGCRAVFESSSGGGGHHGGNRSYRDFGNISGIGNFVVDRSTYHNNGQVREFDAIVNDYQERWWVNCRSGVMGQGNDFDYNSRQGRSRGSAGEVVDFVCSDRY